MITVRANGDLRCIQIPARNLSDTDLPNVEMHFSISSGLKIVSFIPDKGVYNKATQVWEIGLNLKKQTTLFADVCFEVTDITKAPFYVERWLIIAGVEHTLGTTNFTEVFLREEVSAIVPRDKVCASLCGNLNDECEGNCGTGKHKTYKLIAGSEINCEVILDKNGTYSVLPISPTSGGEFKYYMYCEGPAGTDGPYGPVTRSFPATFKGLPCGEVVNCILNGNQCTPAPNQCQICISGILLDKAFGTPCGSGGVCKLGTCSSDVLPTGQIFESIFE